MREADHLKKLVVEKCVSLDSQELARSVLSAGFPLEGSDSSPGLWVGVRYTAECEESRENIDLRIHLQATRPIVGGLRWWFICPASVNGTPCGRRVGKLYLPPGARYIGCRHCHDLTYRSVQEHDKRVDFYRRNPHALLVALENPNVKFSTLLLALRAVG